MSVHPEDFTPDIFSLSIPVPALDVVIFTIYRGSLCVVAIDATPGVAGVDRARLPGWVLRAGEGLDAAFDRILLSKTGLAWVYKEQLMTLGDPGRDSRGHVISIVYYALMDAQTLLSSMDLTRAQLIPVEKMTAMEMAYDHADIVAHARKRLEWRMEYTNIARNILPPRFSLTRLQESYETVFGRALDKRNFRKKILSTGALRETDELDRTSSNRPARLYEFIDEQLETAIES